MPSKSSDTDIPLVDTQEESPKFDYIPKEESNNPLQPPVHNHINQQNNLHINQVMMSSEDMVLLEQYCPGTIDRVLTVAEKQQAHSHEMEKGFLALDNKIADRNVKISKEQSMYTFSKLFVVFLVVVGTGLLSGFLLYNGNIVAGAVTLIFTLLFASIIMLGSSPDKVLIALLGKKFGSLKKQKDNEDESEQ